MKVNCAILMYTSQLEKIKNPFVIRYPRGEAVKAEWKTEMKEIKIGTGRKLKDGEEIAILIFWASRQFCSCCNKRCKA